MRDYVEEQLAHKLLTEEQFEMACPVCSSCGQHITNSSFFYDVDGTYFCDEYECIDKFLKQFRRTVMSYVRNGE